MSNNKRKVDLRETIERVLKRTRMYECVDDWTWMHIFEYLDAQSLWAIGAVCKRFYDFSRLPCIWKSVMKQYGFTERHWKHTSEELESLIDSYRTNTLEDKVVDISLRENQRLAMHAGVAYEWTVKATYCVDTYIALGTCNYLDTPDHESKYCDLIGKVLDKIFKKAHVLTEKRLSVFLDLSIKRILQENYTIRVKKVHPDPSEATISILYKDTGHVVEEEWNEKTKYNIIGSLVTRVITRSYDKNKLLEEILGVLNEMGISEHASEATCSELLGKMFWYIGSRSGTHIEFCSELYPARLNETKMDNVKCPTTGDAYCNNTACVNVLGEYADRCVARMLKREVRGSMCSTIDYIVHIFSDADDICADCWMDLRNHVFRELKKLLPDIPQCRNCMQFFSR